MMNQKAAELYKLSKTISDPVELLLKTLQLIDGENVSDILAKYTNICQNKVKIARVITAKTLTTTQKKNLEQMIIGEIKTEPLFVYEIDTAILGGYIVKINDDVIDESLVKKITKLHLEQL
jgi:F0F1-type ATP synthase delta subunit